MKKEEKEQVGMPGGSRDCHRSTSKAQKEGKAFGEV